MAAFSLLAKDIREHRLPALFLSIGCVVIVLLLLEQNRAAEFSMSSFEIVRFALMSVIPLIALIIGNRLIVKEYLSGTRLFVEALPIGQNLPLLLKFLLGLIYLMIMAAILVLVAAGSASLADEPTWDYLSLVLGKTFVMVWLYWSIVFCFSLCGYLRVILYLLLAAVLAFVILYPGMDSELIPPVALMDDQLFVFERDFIPWNDIAGTAVLGLLFTIAGFVLAHVGDGSVVERLAKPMTRRDYVALGVLASAGLAVWTTAHDQNLRDPIEFSSDYVIREEDPPVSALYLVEAYEEPTQALVSRLSQSLRLLQVSLGLTQIPPVMLALAPGREKYNIDYDTDETVFITANWLDYDSYDSRVLDTVVLHGVLSVQTNGRAMFEPYHWVLDGFTRWWAEQGSGPINPDHYSELVARASWALDSDPSAYQLVSHWQRVADRFAYPTAEALAWSVMAYIEEELGRDVVIALALEFLSQPVGSSALASVRDRLPVASARISQIVGMPVDQLFKQWRVWLKQEGASDSVRHIIDSVPPVVGRVRSVFDANGVHRLEAGYALSEQASVTPDDLASYTGLCVLKHDYIGPFDAEFDVVDDYEDESACQLDSAVHIVDSLYSSGDRVFIALDYEGGAFHQPLRLHAQRLTIPE